MDHTSRWGEDRTGAKNIVMIATQSRLFAATTTDGAIHIFWPWHPLRRVQCDTIARNAINCVTAEPFPTCTGQTVVCSAHTGLLYNRSLHEPYCGTLRE